VVQADFVEEGRTCARGSISIQRVQDAQENARKATSVYGHGCSEAGTHTVCLSSTDAGGKAAELKAGRLFGTKPASLGGRQDVPWPRQRRGASASTRAAKAGQYRRRLAATPS